MIVSYLSIQSELVRKAEKLTGLSAKGYRFPLIPGGFYQGIIDGGETVFSYLDTAAFTETLPRLVQPISRQLMHLFDSPQSILAPMMIDEELWGLLAVFGASLTESDVPAITAFANQAAIAIESAQLYQQVVENASNLEKRVQERTEQYQTIIDLTVDREVRMIGLKDVIEKLRAQLVEAGLEPVADDALRAGMIPDA